VAHTHTHQHPAVVDPHRWISIWHSDRLYIIFTVRRRYLIYSENCGGGGGGERENDRNR
jgi:hypothetical protein